MRDERRIILLKNDRGYVAAKIVLHADSIYLHPPKGHVLKSINREKSDFKKIPFHASYHSTSGFKHLKYDGDLARVASFNVDPIVSEQDVRMESLMRIFPQQPESLPFVKKTRKMDIIVELDKYFPKGPMMFSIMGTNAKGAKITIEAPYESIVVPILNNEKLEVIVAFAYATKPNAENYLDRQERWPEITIWSQ